jgi:hypothetical protein
VGTASNRSGIGARIALTAGGRTQVREIVAGASHMSQSALEAHLGLGLVDRVSEIEIRWPSGTFQTLSDVDVNKRIVIEEP